MTSFEGTFPKHTSLTPLCLHQYLAEAAEEAKRREVAEANASRAREEEEAAKKGRCHCA